MTNSIIEKRAEAIKQQEIEMGYGNAETEANAKMTAKKEYSDLIGTMQEINRLHGEGSVNIDKALEKVENASAEQFVNFCLKVNNMLDKIKQK